MHRGAASADFDRDGRVDAVITRLNEPAILLRNIADSGNHWLTVHLTGVASNRDGIGARLVLTTAGSRQVNHSTSAVGYAFASDKAIHFGPAVRVSCDDD